MQNKFNIFSPWMVNFLHWGLIVLLLLTLPTTLWPLTQRFWVSILLWMIGFTGTALLLGWKNNSISQEDTPTFTFNQAFYNILLCISLLLTPIYLFKMYQLILSFGLDNMMYAARTAALDEDTNLGAVAYCVIINQVLFVTTVFAGKQLPWWKHMIVTLLYFLCGLVIMEKGTFIFMVIIAVMVYYRRNLLKIRHLVIVGVLLIASAFVFTLARSDASDSMAEQSSFQDFFETYLLASPVAYCYMPEETLRQSGSNTFSQFYLIGNKLHLGNFVVKDKLQEFIEVPVSTNTYTVFQPFYLDFGQWGVFLFAIIYGIIFGFTYKYFQAGNSFATVFYGYLVVMLCTQFHQEEIFTSFIRTIQYIFFAFILTILSSTNKEKEA